MMPPMLRKVCAAAAVWILPAKCTRSSPPPMAEKAPAEAEKCEVEGVQNLYRVSRELYRSGQPTPQGFSNLWDLGARSILNMREYHKDSRKARHTDLQLLEYPVAAGEVKEEDVENCLRMMCTAPKPVVVHCWHGSDRTGIIVAAWRIIYENWSVAQAEAEFRMEIYGHHDFWYGNLVKLLRETDWAAMRARLLAYAESLPVIA